MRQRGLPRGPTKRRPNNLLLDNSHISSPPSPPLIPLIAMPCTILAMPKRAACRAKTCQALLLCHPPEAPRCRRSDIGLGETATSLFVVLPRGLGISQHPLLMRWSAKVPLLVAPFREKIRECIFNRVYSQPAIIHPQGRFSHVGSSSSMSRGLLVTTQQVVMWASVRCCRIVLQARSLGAQYKASVFRASLKCHW
jgi:hypothetical protein